MSNKTTQVAVIGAGFGGLASALLLSRAGVRVTLFEQASVPGGRARSPSVGGSPMNLGAHAFYRGGPAEELLTQLGVSWHGHRPGAQGVWLTSQGKCFRFPSSPWAFLTSSLLNVRAKLQLSTWLMRLDRLSPSSLAGERCDAWLDRCFSEPMARRIAGSLTRLVCYAELSHAVDASIALTLLKRVFGSRSTGVAYLGSGFQGLVNGLFQQLSTAQVSLRFGSQVSRVSGEGELQLANGETEKYDQIVVALPYGRAREIAGLPSQDAAMLEVKAACWDLVLSQPPSCGRHFVLSLDEPFYFSVHEQPGSSGPQRAHALRYLSAGESTEGVKERLAAWLCQIDPQFNSYILHQRFLPNMLVSSALPSPQTFLPAHGCLQFVGDYQGSGLLLDAVAASAQVACGTILGLPAQAA